MKKSEKLFSCLENLFFHRISSPITTAVYIYGRTAQIIVYCPGNRGRLGIRSTCLIQIYLFHKNPPHNVRFKLIYKSYL